MDKMTNTLHETATLVRLTAKHPSGIKRDGDMNKHTADHFKVQSSKLIQTNKHIFGHDINKYFRRILNQFRNGFYYDLTVPWSNNGTDNDGYKVVGWRLCPNTNLTQLQSEVDKAKIEWNKEVKEFLKNYANMLEGAKRNLGDAYKESDYEVLDQIKHRFVFEFELEMVPSISDDIRTTVSAEQRKLIEGQTANRLAKNVRTILVTTIDALVEQVEHVSAKLQEYDPKNKKASYFNKSSFDKLRTALDMLPRINSDILGNDATITGSHQKLVSIMATIDSVESLRDDSVAGNSRRKKLADDLAGAIDDLKGGFLDSAFGGSKDD